MITGKSQDEKQHNPIGFGLLVASVSMEKYSRSKGSYNPTADEKRSMEKSAAYLRAALSDYKTHEVVAGAVGKNKVTENDIGKYATVLEMLGQGEQVQMTDVKTTKSFVSKVLKSLNSYEGKQSWEASLGNGVEHLAA